jgi:hypothetical protein
VQNVPVPVKEKSDDPADKYFKANAKDREVRAWHCTLLQKGELHKNKYNPVKIVLQCSAKIAHKIENRKKGEVCYFTKKNLMKN